MRNNSNKSFNKVTKEMRTKIIMIFSLCLLLAGRANAQWVVTDPTNLAQGIVNTTKQIIQTSSTASNMIKNFQETVKNTTMH